MNVYQKLAKPDIDQTRVQALKASAELTLKLINKYLPDLQSIEGNFNHTNNKPVEQLTEAELDALIAETRAREEAENQGSDSVH